MKRAFLYSFAALCSIVLLAACQKTTEPFKTESLEDYYPLKIGKYIIYQLDSTVLLPFGSGFKVTSFQVKDEVDAEITDASDRKSFRMIRYLLTDTIHQIWKPIGSFLITPLDKSVELVDDNNHRTIKLQLPIVNDFSWKGNKYIDTYSPGTNIQYLDNWEFSYQNINEPFQTLQQQVSETIFVLHRDEKIGIEADKQNYFEQNYSVEVFGKGIGLIYKEFMHKEYQPGNTPPSSGKYVDGSYGIKLSMIEHN